MKKILIVLFTVLALNLFAQEQVVVYADTIANSASDSTDFKLDRYRENGAVIDSLVISYFASGEIDLDTIDVYMGFEGSVTYPATGGTLTQIAKSFETTAVSSAALTTNLAESATEIVQDVVTLSAENVEGYNYVRIKIGAGAAGCDATDTNQKVAIYVQVFTSKT